MPKSKLVAKSDSSDSDSGPEDRGPAKKQVSTPPPPKKQKVSTPPPAEENTWDLGSKRFVKLTEFKGKWYVNIREFYDAGGELKPGKKGIMLTMEQWQKFKGIIPDIEDAVKRNV